MATQLEAKLGPAGAIGIMRPLLQIESYSLCLSLHPRVRRSGPSQLERGIKAVLEVCIHTFPAIPAG